jgi:hypothetical protein
VVYDRHKKGGHPTVPELGLAPGENQDPVFAAPSAAGGLTKTAIKTLIIPAPMSRPERI